MHHFMLYTHDCEKYVVYYTLHDEPVASKDDATSTLGDVVIFRQALNCAGVIFTPVKEREDKLGLHGVFW